MRPVSRGCFWALSLSPRVTCHPHYHEATCPPWGGPCPMFSPESLRLSERSAANWGPVGPLPASAAPILKNKATDQWKVAPVHRQTMPVSAGPSRRCPAGLRTCDAQNRRGPASGSVRRSGEQRTWVLGGSPRSPRGSLRGVKLKTDFYFSSFFALQVHIFCEGVNVKGLLSGFDVLLPNIPCPHSFNTSKLSLGQINCIRGGFFVG